MQFHLANNLELTSTVDGSDSVARAAALGHLNLALLATLDADSLRAERAGASLDLERGRGRCRRWDGDGDSDERKDDSGEAHSLCGRR